MENYGSRSGVDLPPNKRAQIGLTYIYGVGKSRATAILDEAAINANAKIRDLSEDELNKIRAIIDGQGEIEGDLRKRPDGHQAAYGYRLLSRAPSQTQSAGSQLAHIDKRSYSQRSA